MVDKMLIPSPHFIIQNNPKVVWSAILSIPEKNQTWGFEDMESSGVLKK